MQARVCKKAERTEAPVTYSAETKLGSKSKVAYALPPVRLAIRSGVVAVNLNAPIVSFIVFPAINMFCA